MKLYEISSEFLSVIDAVSEDGELSQGDMDYLDGLQQDFELKAVAVASYIKNLEAESIAINAAMQDMRIRRDKLDKRIESLSEYLQFNLISLSINEIKTCPYFKIRIKKCPPSVDVINEEEIPNDYWEERVTKVLSKRNILDDLKEGQEIPGVAIKNNLKLEIK